MRRNIKIALVSAVVAAASFGLTGAALAATLAPTAERSVSVKAEGTFVISVEKDSPLFDKPGGHILSDVELKPGNYKVSDTDGVWYRVSGGWVTPQHLHGRVIANAVLLVGDDGAPLYESKDSDKRKEERIPKGVYDVLDADGISWIKTDLGWVNLTQGQVQLVG